MSQNPNEQEKSDLAVLQAALTKKKLDCFDYMLSLSRMDTVMLGHCGHQDLGSALKYALESTRKELKKLMDAHLRKYPD